VAHYLYVIESLKENRKYIGISANPEKRLKKHNRGEVRSTKFYRPWRLLNTEEFKTKTLARKREIYLKNNYQERKRTLSMIE